MEYPKRWRDWEGWLNNDTHHAAMVLFNDRRLIDKIDGYIKKGTLQDALSLQLSVKGQLPPDCRVENVDAWSIQYHRAKELHENGELTDAQMCAHKVALNKDSSSCRKMRMELLEKNGFKTTDPFFDHEGAWRALEAHEAIHATINESINPEPPMEATLKLEITTINYVNGNDIAKLSLDQQVDLISKTEKRIEELSALKTKSKAITKEIETLEANLAKLVEIIDAQ